MMMKYPNIMVHAQRYFGEIMMPFSSMVRKALQKIEGLDVDMIAPSHGPVYRNPQRIIDAHKKWSRGETQEKVLIVYVSMYGTNEEIARKLADRLIAEGIEVEVYDLVSSDIGDIAKDLVDSRAIVLAAPTVLAGAHPLAVYAAYLVKALRPPAKYALLIGSHGWYGKSNDALLEMLKGLNFELIGTLDIHARPSAGDYNEFLRLTDLLIKRLRRGEDD
ncbi:flavodoxin domain-containing protein [Thermococcus sp.]